MSDARVVHEFEDKVRAREFLEQADQFVADADVTGLSAPAQAVLLHNAAVCACDAILQGAGLRVTGGDGSHALRLETALDQIDGDTEDLLERLDASRARRNEASYAAQLVAEASVAEARQATAEVVELARGFLAD